MAYAEDINPISSTKTGLQEMVNKYRIYCNKRPPYNKRPSPISAPFDTKIII